MREGVTLVTAPNHMQANTFPDSKGQEWTSSEATSVSHRPALPQVLQRGLLGLCIAHVI